MLAATIDSDSSQTNLLRRECSRSHAKTRQATRIAILQSPKQSAATVARAADMQTWLVCWFIRLWPGLQLLLTTVSPWCRCYRCRCRVGTDILKLVSASADHEMAAMLATQLPSSNSRCRYRSHLQHRSQLHSGLKSVLAMSPPPKFKTLRPVKPPAPSNVYKATVVSGA